MAALVARRNPAAVLDLVEKPLDLIPGSIEIRAEADRIVAIAVRRDVGPRALHHGKLSDPVGVVATVGEKHRPGFQTRQQFAGKSNVMSLSGLSASRIGRPLLLTTEWILLVKPPRDLPIDWR
jgi:hypothetical protein